MPLLINILACRGLVDQTVQSNPGSLSEAESHDETGISLSEKQTSFLKGDFSSTKDLQSKWVHKVPYEN